MVFFSHAITRIEVYQFRAHGELAKPLPSADEFSFSDIFRMSQCLKSPSAGVPRNVITLYRMPAALSQRGADSPEAPLHPSHVAC